MWEWLGRRSRKVCPGSRLRLRGRTAGYLTANSRYITRSRLKWRRLWYWCVKWLRYWSWSWPAFWTRGRRRGRRGGERGRGRREGRGRRGGERGRGRREGRGRRGRRRGRPRRTIVALLAVSRRPLWYHWKWARASSSKQAAGFVFRWLSRRHF